MAIKRVILHLGMGKAGSSSIQHALFTNSSVLESNGFRYLNEWGENHTFVFANIFHLDSPVPFGNELFGKDMHEVIPEEERKNKIMNLIETMLEVMNTTECETLILSGEYWWNLAKISLIENIQKFIKDYFLTRGIETTIVYLVRNPLTWMISFSHQRVFYGKDFLGSNFIELSGERLYGIKQIPPGNYYDAIINLIKYFYDSLILMKFEDAVNDKDGLVGFFLKTIGFPEKK